jgi:hypothetical protein
MINLINFLLVIEVIACIGLLGFLFAKLHKHTKKSPAEKALEAHLVELEAAAQAAKQETKKQKPKK